MEFFCLFIIIIIFCLFVFSVVTPMSYGDSQARGPIRAAAASLHHNNRIQATSATYTTAHSNARSLTH